MKKIFKKRVIIPALALVLLFGAVSFKSDFFEIAKQIEIFTTMFKQLNMNYVDETNPAELMDGAIKEMLSGFSQPTEESVDYNPYRKQNKKMEKRASKRKSVK